ncbi:MAG: hypothetical protein IJD07_01150, partial [Clostridia bacterium]|nr:hypothetical protein [Clostridia bacterium]
MGKKKGYYLDKDGNIVDASESSGKKSKRKKKGCCYKTCCAAVITSLVLVVLVSAAGCYFGNKLLTENYDVTLAQVFGILGDVKNTNEKKIVKNKFSAKDFDSAEDSLKSAIFLKEDADFSLETLVDLALESALESDDSGARFMTALSDGENPENTETDNAIVEYIKSALVYENIDVEKLKGYDISKIDEYKLTLTDKELGGIIQRVFEKIMTSELVTKELETSLADMGLTAHDLALEKNFTLKQVIFDNADGESRVKATICFNLHKVITVITDKLDYQKLTGDANIAKYGKIGVKVVRPLIKALLPKKILLTADISLKEGGAPKFYLNNMSQKDMNIAYDLIDKISGTEGTSDSIKNSINEPFMEGGSIYNALKKVNEQVIDLNQAVGKGKLTLDVVQLGIDALKVNYEKNEQGEEVKKDPSECISSHDVYSGLSLVYGTSTDDVIGENGSKTAFDYNNIKILFDDEGKVMLDEDGLPKYEFVYQYDALLIEQGKNIIDDYEKAFLQEMSNCYGLKEGATFDEIIDVFSGLEGATSDVFGLFDTEKLKQIINSESRGGIISDTMLAAIVNEKIADFLGDKAEFADMFSLKYLILSSKDEHTFAELGIYIEVAKLLGDNLDGEVAQIVTGILPKAFVISCKLDVTLGATEFADPEIRINDSAKTQDMVNLIDGLGLLGEGDDGQKIKIGAYLNDMLSPVRDTLHKMSDTLPGLALGTSKVMLPDIFDALAAFINSSNEGGNTISSTDLAQAMRVLTTDAPHNPLFDLTAADYENFGKSLLDEFNQTLALKKDDGKGNDYTLSDIMNNLGLGDGSVEAEQIINLIDSAKLEEIINASEIDRAFITDASGTSDMAVALIREVIGEYLAGDVAEFISAESILGIKIEEESGKTYLTVIVDVDISSLLGTDADEMMNFVMQLLPSKTVLTVKVDVTAGASEYAPTEIKYNFNDDSDKVMELI